MKTVSKKILNLSRKGYSLNKISEIEGEIVGIFTGDGSQHYDGSYGHYQTNIHFGNDLKYIEYVKRLYQSYFNKNWFMNKEVTKGGNIKYRLRVSNKKIFYFFDDYIDYNKHKKHDTVKLKSLRLQNSFIIGFLRGLIDTDGTIVEYENRIRVMYYTTSKVLSKQIKRLLQNFNIEGNVYRTVKKSYKDLYTVQIFQKGIYRFLKLVKPFKGRKFQKSSGTLN